ncbi:hypothetical protein RRG08_056516 [Elysia crispata]|uniref:Uncharacterized protein n=1 Tax=Elysia crispata TaxID=231223 RepID=A0AAE1D868_9GAST|nr:hypothetical protein RRG08_056516 [Elysia crispata]
MEDFSRVDHQAHLEAKHQTQEETAADKSMASDELFKWKMDLQAVLICPSTQNRVDMPHPDVVAKLMSRSQQQQRMAERDRTTPNKTTLIITMKDMTTPLEIRSHHKPRACQQPWNSCQASCTAKVLEGCHKIQASGSPNPTSSMRATNLLEITAVVAQGCPQAYAGAT